MICSPNEEIEAKEQLTLIGSKQAGVKTDLEFLILYCQATSANLKHFWSEYHQKIAIFNWKALAFRSFEPRIKNVANCIALLSSEENESFSKEWYERIELDDLDAGSSKIVLFQKGTSREFSDDK